MKNYILPLITLLALTSCQEEEVQPVDFAGSYYLQSQEAEIEIGFSISEDGTIHNYGNSVFVKHPLISEHRWNDNNISTAHRFDNGYGRIDIISRSVEYYRVTLIYARLNSEGLNVYDVQIDILGQPFMVLPDQVFERKSL
jgi:hypothetical protein